MCDFRLQLMPTAFFHAIVKLRSWEGRRVIAGKGQCAWRKTLSLLRSSGGLLLPVLSIPTAAAVAIAATTTTTTTPPTYTHSATLAPVRRVIAKELPIWYLQWSAFSGEGVAYSHYIWIDNILFLGGMDAPWKLNILLTMDAW